jgi:hypothetical protein
LPSPDEYSLLLSAEVFNLCPSTFLNELLFIQKICSKWNSQCPILVNIQQ